MDDEKDLHQGHRQRMRDIYRQKGIDAFTDIEVLEFILSYALPRIDTNPIAHRLLNAFGSLYQVLDASVEQLERVEGVGPRTADLIRFNKDLWRRYEFSKVSNEKYLRTTRSIGRFLIAKIGSLREEHAFLLSLDQKCKLLDFREITSGTVNEINMPYRRVAEAALAANASSVVLAHNHPNGMTVPSLEDIKYTKELKEILKQLDVYLADHFIIAEQFYCSMKASGVID